MKILESHIAKIYRNDNSKDEPWSLFVAEYKCSFSVVKTGTNDINNELQSISTQRGNAVIKRDQLLSDTDKHPKRSDMLKIYTKNNEYVGSFKIRSIIPQRRDIGFILGEFDDVQY